MKKHDFILDSFAVLAFLQADQKGLQVKEILKNAEAGNSAVLMSAINLGEIVYIVERRMGRKVAEGILKDIYRLPVSIVDANMQRILSAAHIKASYPVSYADAFAVALAREEKGVIVTADPEFKKVEKIAHILWL